VPDTNPRLPTDGVGTTLGSPTNKTGGTIPMTATNRDNTLEIIARMSEIEDPFLGFAVCGDDGDMIRDEDGHYQWLSHGIPDRLLAAMNNPGTDWTVLDWLFSESLDADGNPRNWSDFLPWAVAQLITGIESGLFVAMLFRPVPPGGSLPGGGRYLSAVDHALSALGYASAIQQHHRGRRAFEIHSFPDTWFYLDHPHACTEDAELACPGCGLLASSGAAPDPCLGKRRPPGVYRANCGHGDVPTAFVVFDDGAVMTGVDAVHWFSDQRLGFAPWPGLESGKGEQGKRS
jgi:hypothetical protein